VKIAAAATAAKGTAKARVKIVPDHLGMPAGLELEGEGAVSLREPSADYSFDLAEVLGIAGLLTGTDLTVRVAGDVVYADPPSIPTVDIPDGWLSADVPELARALDPGAQLRALATEGDLEEVGKETVDGVRVRHFKSGTADVWIDGDHVLRGLHTAIELTEGDGRQPGELDITYDLSDYGAELDAQAPEDATDITDTVREILKSPDTLGKSGGHGG
jgi:hypothetical protein